MPKYLLHEDSEFSSATVDDVQVHKTGEAVELNKGQVKRLEEIEGVKLSEAKND